MSRNRIIYNSQALYVSQDSSSESVNGSESISQLSRIQSFSDTFTRNFININNLGSLTPINRIEVENPNITANFSYYLTNGSNEQKIGLNVYPINTTQTVYSCISNFITQKNDKSYYLLITEGGDDAVSTKNVISGAIGLGNSLLTSYSVSASVGELATAEIEIQSLNTRIYSNLTNQNQVPTINTTSGVNMTNTFFQLPSPSSFIGVNTPSALQPGDITLEFPTNVMIGSQSTDLKIQDFTFSFNLDRNPLKKVGKQFPFEREINFPIIASLELNAIIGDLKNDNLISLICSENQQFIISFKTGCYSNKQTALSYIFKGARLISQKFDSSIGNSSTMNATYEVEFGDAEDTDKGIFILGS